MTISEILKRGAAELNVPLSDEQISSLERYSDILKEKNKVMNLTAVTDDEGIAVKHFLDSLTALQTGKVGKSVIDVGTGAGFPGLVIKIEKPETEVTLIDSVRKKVDYLRTAINELGLEGITAIHTRIEDMGGKESFDTVTARAVAPMNVLAEYCLPFVRQGGCMVAYKSVNAEEELKEAERAIKLLGGKTEENRIFELDEETKRRIIVIRKVKKSPDIYPRSGNKPRLKPL